MMIMGMDHWGWVARHLFLQWVNFDLLTFPLVEMFWKTLLRS